MKKSTLLLVLLAALTFTSCDYNDDNCCCEDSQSFEYELVSCDTQDNVIKIDGVWQTNSNLDPENWQYENEVGFRLNNPHFTVSVNDGRKILDAELFNFDYTLSVYRPNDHTVVFYSTQMTNYLNNTDVFHVNLKLTTN